MKSMMALGLFGLALSSAALAGTTSDSFNVRCMVYNVEGRCSGDNSPNCQIFQFKVDTQVLEPAEPVNVAKVVLESDRKAAFNFEISRDEIHDRTVLLAYGASSKTNSFSAEVDLKAELIHINTNARHTTITCNRVD